MNKQQIKKEAKNFFSKKEFQSSINKLWELGVNDFISFCLKFERDRKTKKVTKENWFKNTDFLEQLCGIQDIFMSLFESKKADELLFSYFSKKTQFSKKFEQKIASEFPQLFINAVRVSQIFMDDKRFNFFDSLELSEDFQIHKKVWKHLQAIDKQYWSYILSNLEGIAKIDIFEILTRAVTWFNKKLQEKSHLQDLNHLASVYSFFIELYMQVKNPSSLKIPKEQIDKINATAKVVNSHLEELLENINLWIMFNDTTLSAYCFDLNVLPKSENGIIYFNLLPETYYKWKLDGTRYNVTRNEYLFRYIQPDNIPINKEDFIYIGKEKLKLFLGDLKIQKLNNVPVEDLYSPLIELSVNCKLRFDKNKSKHPFVFLNIENLGQNKIENISIDSKKIVTQVVNLFSYKSVKEFDRLNIKYNVWNQPFINISGNLFCPKIFLADNDWFYAFAQVGLQNLALRRNSKERKETSTLMEETLGEKFKINGWIVKVTTQEDENIMTGDVDIIIEDKYTTLYIQLKRTKFRLNPKDTYYEFINSDRKAAQQLNGTEKYLSNQNDIFNPKHKPVKWIATTSYENILTEIDGCIKVNYFDILNALSRPFGKTLQNFIDFIYKDKQIINLINIFNSGNINYEFYAREISDIGLPVTLEYPSRYRIAMFAGNELKIDYDKVYEKAVELDKIKKHEKAIHLLNKCLEINPEDIDVYIALGNTFANTKKYSNAISSLKKALKISPQDPYVLREYSSILMESSKYYEGLNILLNLCEKYPFVGDFRFLFEEKFELFRGLKLLKMEQKIRLKRRWDKLQ